MLRSGDLESGIFGTARPLEGIRYHQKIQKSRPPEYISEVTVARTVETDDFVLEIGGRIDGVFVYPDKAVIEEIKTTTRDPEEAAARMNSIHWGQASCYAFMYAERENLDDIDIQLTYCNIDSGEMKEVVRSFTFAELEAFFNDLITRYLAWAKTLADWVEIRNESIRALAFPFPGYRPGQRHMAADIYRTIRDGGRLIVQAPTGIGKTMAALFPAIKAIPECATDKIFYLTARTTGKTVAEKALDDMRASGLKVKNLTITAKERICFSPGKACSGDECEYALGHYDRIKDAIGDAFTSDSLSRETIESAARRHTVCPFELSLDLSLWADCIVCDYNYAFDPTVYLRRFFEDEKGAYVFLVDEAHNLPDRAREMFSAEIDKDAILELRRAVKGSLDGIHRILGSVNTAMLHYRKLCDDTSGFHAEHERPDTLLKPLRRFVTSAERWLVHNIQTDFRHTLLDMYFTANSFLRVGERFDTNYAACFEKKDTGFTAKLYCIDPSAQLHDALGRARSTVFFSATMSPADYFRGIFGLDDATRTLILPSPFPSDNLAVVSADTISTLYRNRSKTISDVAGIIGEFATAHTGNYLMFFPSYDYMTTVYDSFAAAFPEVRTIVQSRGMSEMERDRFLEQFAHDNDETLAGFAIMGGVFGEGIDLIGDRLTGAVIVGVGLPGISPERELIREYFAAKNNSGFEYAYQYPGLTKVLQAAGRVIRSETDRGVVILVDERFATIRYRRLLPKEWRIGSVSSPVELRPVLHSFWK